MTRSPETISFLLLPTDPKANYLAHKDEIDRAIFRVLESGQYVLGKEVSSFEHEFAEFIRVDHVIGVSCGTDALHLALRACDIGPGDTVMTVSHTAVATVAAIELAGATPLLVEIDPTTFTMDPNCVEDAVKEHKKDRRLKAIIPVHLYGYPADMRAIMDIARRHNLYVIEDCAQSHGAAIGGQRTGAWGDLAAFSFYPTKNLAAFGDGGAVVANHPELAERVRLLREYGWKGRYISELPGMNSRLDELQAAILRVKLQYLDRENKRRQELALIYTDLLRASSLTLPRECHDVDHIYHQYVVRCEDRDGLKVFLEAHGIRTLIHYPVPVHLQPAYRQTVAIAGGTLLHTEQACREILSLPMHPYLANEDAQRVSDLIARWQN